MSLSLSSDFDIHFLTRFILVFMTWTQRSDKLPEMWAEKESLTWFTLATPIMVLQFDTCAPGL
jgi:hypothetical protein